MAPGDLPIIGARTAAEDDAVRLDRRFGEGPASPALAARIAPAGRITANIIGQLARLAASSPGVGAEPQLDSVGHWRAELDTSAKPMRRHCILQQHARCAR